MINMTFFDRLYKIKDSQNTKLCSRLIAELSYCYALTGKDNAGRALVENTAVIFRDILDRDGYITKEQFLKAEESLMVLAPLAKSYKLLFAAHAHIDMNWLWGYNETVSITLETFRTILKLMDEYPDFIFSQSQASCYAIVEKFDPRMHEAIKRRIREGRWEVTAATWTENDKNMPNAESLARHQLYTRRYMHGHYDLPTDAVQIEFQPDTFGHTRATPEILSKAGREYYYFCRGRIPKPNLFNWKGSTGATILVYQEAFWYNTYAGGTHDLVYDFIREVPAFCGENQVDTCLKVYGLGDHGGGPSRHEIETIYEIMDFPLGPTVKFSSFHEFFRSVEPFRDRFPTVEGEINFIVTGCFSSQSKIKMANRYSENKLYTAEALSALSHIHAGGSNYSEMYAEAWKDVMFNQFHDILPGSCIADSQDHALGLFQNVMGYATAGSSLALNELAAAIDTLGIDAEDREGSLSEGAGVGFIGEMHNDRAAYPDRYNIIPAERGGGKIRIFHVFNPFSADRAGVVEFVIWDYDGDTTRLVLSDTEGSRPIQQITEASGSFWCHKYTKLQASITIPAFAYATYIVTELARTDFDRLPCPNPRQQYIHENILENSKIKARFDDRMNLVSLTDIQTGTELIKEKSGYFKFAEHNTAADTFDMTGNAWVEGPEMRARSLNDTERVAVNSRCLGEIPRQWIKYTIVFLQSKMDVTVSLDHDGSMLKYYVQVNWAEFYTPERGIPSLKFNTPFSYEASTYLYQSQLGLIERGEMRFDAPARDFVFAPDGKGGGISLLSDYLYGYRCENNSMQVTMLRASQYPDPFPEVGVRIFHLGIAVAKDEPAALFQLAFNMTGALPYITNKRHAGSLPLNWSFMQLKGPVAATGIKAPEDGTKGLILRMAEIGGFPGTVSLCFADVPSRVNLADIHENILEGGRFENNEFIFDVKANELVTVRVEYTS